MIIARHQIRAVCRMLQSYLENCAPVYVLSDDFLLVLVAQAVSQYLVCSHVNPGFLYEQRLWVGLVAAWPDFRLPFLSSF